jgi:hypothetical protein
VGVAAAFPVESSPIAAAIPAIAILIAVELIMIICLNHLMQRLALFIRSRFGTNKSSLRVL